MARSASTPSPRRRADRARLRGRAPGGRRERGVALLLVLLVIVLGASYAGMRGLNAAYAKPERDARTMAALQQAKQALLGYAANRARLLGLSPSTARDVPGALPCPAASLATTDAEYGRARLTCNVSVVTPAILVGRLPWRTLELPELTDATGEGLWYAVSQSFRYNQTGMSPVNAHSQGRIRLKAGGVVQQSRIVAVIAAPGAIIQGQVRGSTSERHDVANYLERYEISPTVGVDFDFYAGLPTAEVPPFNDVMVTITEAELFDAIDNAVARRLDESIMPLLVDHRNFWGTLPLPTGGFDPSQSPTAMAGLGSMLWGHLPVAQQTPEYQPGYATTGTPTILCSGPSGAPLPNPILECQVSGAIGATFTIDAPLSKINKGIFAPMSTTTFAIVPSSSANIVITGQSVEGSEDATVRIQGTLVQASATVQLLVPAQTLVSRATPPPSGTPVEWFLFSQWAKFVYYARCSNSAILCMTVGDVGGASTAARATLVLAGRPIQKQSDSLVQNQSSTTSVAITEYLEPPHGAGTTTFQRRVRTHQFNDRVVAMP